MTQEPPTSVPVGDVSIVSLIDAFGTFASFNDAFPGASSTVVALARERHPGLFAGDRWVLPFRAFLLRHADANVLVDAGVGPRPGRFLPERQGWLPSALARAGTRTEDVDVVLLTHAHVDHIGWTVDDAGDAVFPNAAYLLSRAEWSWAKAGGGEPDVIASRVFPLERLGILRLLRDEEEEVVPGVTALATPGHTPGHVSVVVRSRGERACVLGDVAVHPAQLLDPGLAYAHEVDPALAAATRSRLLACLADERSLVCAGHFPASGFGFIERADSGYRWLDR